MEGFSLPHFAREVHQNAVEHGWWDQPRTSATLRALMHCELSEAVESARKGEPLYYHQCPYNRGICEHQDVHDENGPHCEACSGMRKPEGAAVELIDCAIRMLDYLAHRNYVFICDDLIALEICSVHAFESVETPDILSADVADFAEEMHTCIACAAMDADDGQLAATIGLICAWVRAHGFEPEKLLMEKHEYNKPRSYKHGGKVF